MPNNSNNSINNFSPNFRDALLGRNLLADSIKDNSLTSWLDSINKPVAVENIKGPHVQSSEDIEVKGPGYRVENSKFNKNKYISNDYKGFNIPFNSVDIIFPDVSYGKYSTAPIASPTTDGPKWRETENTILNIFKEGGKEYSTNEIIKYVDTNITLNTDYITDFGDENSPENTDSQFRRELNVTQNQFRSSNYERVSLELLPFEVNASLATLNLDPNTYAPTLEAYTENHVPANGPFLGGNIRQFTTSKNTFLDVDKQTRIDLNTHPVPTGQRTSYLDNNNNLNYGNTRATQLVDVIGGFLTGGGVGFDPNSGNPVPDFDVRSSLAGRGLTSAGLLDDTRLGQISPKYLAAAIGNNIAFNIQEETIGRINTNPLSLATGGSLIIPNNKITVGDGLLGTGADIIERMTGAKVPVSLLPSDADIFSYNTKGYVGVGNIERANAMIANTGKGTVGYLFANINANVNTNFLGKRGGYAPGFNDADGNEVNKWSLYALEQNDGKVLDVLSDSPENSPSSNSSHNLSGVIYNSGFYAPSILARYNGKPSGRFLTDDKSYLTFTWGDTKWNKSTETVGNISTKLMTNSTETKSILHKTQELFNSRKIRTLISGKGVKPETWDNELTTTTRGFMSKGSAVLKNGGRGIDVTDDNVDEVFARAWSPVDSYNQYRDLQKHSPLSNEGRVDNVEVTDSVLGLNGIVKIAPHKNNNIQKFMFSLENLAWDGQTNKLLDCEKGPGDLLTGSKGRIMWFPPYDMVINESTSANWERNNFIGRGEPIYTYNNTERTGTLGFKIVVDHPNYINFMSDATNEDLAAFFAGALSIKEIRNNVLNDDEKAAYDVANTNKQIEGVPAKKSPDFEFNLYYRNDDSEVPLSSYEDGYTDTDDLIDYDLYPKGIVYKENSTQILKVYGEGTTKGEGIVGTKGRSYTDNTNFGLNGINNPISIPDSPQGDPYEAYGWYEFSGEDADFTNYFTIGNCKYCRFDIIGYASPQGDATKNQELAKARAENLKDYIINNGFLRGIPSGDAAKRIKTSSEALTSTGCVAGSSTDNYQCKKDRRVTVRVKYDTALEKAANPTPVERDRNEPSPKQQIPLSRFYTECDYFEQIGAEEDSFIARDIRDKIKNFSPAFHAITPEGFNSRLTFLQQCMRQGPTTNSNTPDNLAFGRPPVCILRIGDFYHTKIIIESLTIDYEPLVWDLNPEGVGVQPMIANINLSFAFIGGSSLKGPINRLQNAISFNYFANTELYDPRAERIKKIEDPEKDGPTGEIVEGRFPFPKEVVERLEDEALDAQIRAEFEAKARAEEEARLADISAEEARLEAIENDQFIILSLKISSYKNYGEFVGFDLEIDNTTSLDNKKTSLTTEFQGELFITNALTSEQILIGFLRAIPVDDKSYAIEAQSFDGVLDETVLDIVDGQKNIGLVNFSLFDHPDYDKIMALLKPCREFTSEGSVGCKNGDHQLVMKWPIEGGANRSPRVYNEANNTGLPGGVVEKKNLI